MTEITFPFGSKAVGVSLRLFPDDGPHLVVKHYALIFYFKHRQLDKLHNTDDFKW